MTEKSLNQIYAEHTGKVSDKWSSYLSEYDRIFHEYRYEPVHLLEIGIQNGGSLEIWSKYFANAQKLVGCDIDPECARLSFEDSRIVMVIEDANSTAGQAAVLSHSPTFDLIIDDGSHRTSDIVRSFAMYFPHLSEGGIFVAEDLHCSYWQEFEGGLFDPFSSMTFFKRLTDIVNHEHWGIEKTRTDILNGFFSKYGFQVDAEALLNIHSVEFINSMCVIRKAPPEQNRLGARIVAGLVEMVVPGHEELRLTFSGTPNQTGNEWTARSVPPDEEFLIKIRDISDREQRIASLNETITNRDNQIARFNEVILDQDSQIASFNESIANRDDQINKFNDAMVGRDHQIVSLSKAVTERDGQIAALHNSTSWRIMGPIRVVAHQIKRGRRVAELTLPAIQHGGGFKNALEKAIRLYRGEGLAGIKRGFRLVALSGKAMPSSGSDAFDRNNYSEWIRRYDTLTDDTRTIMRACIDDFVQKPLISVVMPTYNSKLKWLVEAIESVRRQIYPHWELCIADDASTDKAIRHFIERCAKEDSRIKVVFREQNGHISAASNSALELATGKWVALLDHDDLLSEHALFWVADSINKNPDARLIYSDEDKIDEVGKRFNPYFKCDWNIDLFYSHNMFSHLGIYDAGLLREIGGFRLGLEGSQDYDLALRCIERIELHQIHHISRVLYHWRMHAASTAKSAASKPYAMLAGEKALNDHFQRQKTAAKAELIGYGYRVHYALPDNPPMVSLVIPTKNGLQLIRRCIESILEKTTYTNYEILIVDNGSDDPATLKYFIDLKAESRIRVVRDDRPFNYSALNNAAVEIARGEVLGLLNNDLEVISPEWLSEMVSIAIQPRLGAVGARLWYPCETLQHGGVILGLGASHVAGHAHYQMPKGYNGYFGRASLINSFSAVSAACLVIQKAIYEEVHGLNQTDLQIAFNDVDFCLRLREKGYRNVWTPYAELYHHESATRGHEDTPEKQSRFTKESQYMKQHWGDLLLCDPAYSPNLTLDHADFTLAWPPRISHVPI